MSDYRAMFDRDYIGAWDLGGRDVTVSIARVKAGELTAQGGRKSKKPIIWFDGKERGWVVNKTNAKTIAAMYGNDTSNWIGKRITLFPTTTSMGSETVDCIRVRPKIPAGRPRKVNGDAPAPEQPPATHTSDTNAGPPLAKGVPWDEQEPPLGALEEDRDAG